jgi:1-acyl-sn-glycerol-3-phosphate acyltransferase
VEHAEELEKQKSYMFIANHTSMIDIMLMLASVNMPFVFVGKKELAKIPIFGFFYKKTCILVDRSSARSRQGVFLRAQRRLQSGVSVCIFPEGKVPEEHIVLDQFMDGAFRLAINHEIPIAPLVFLDNKKRFSYTFFSGGPGILRVKKLRFLSTVGLTVKDTSTLNERARQMVLRTLQD